MPFALRQLNTTMDVINIDDSDDDRSISNNNTVVASNNNHDDYDYKIMLLMDHREFGLRADRNYLNEVENRINRRFGGTYCEIVSLKAADYMFIVRKISKATNQVVDQRLFDLIIERKDVADLASCLITKSKDYRPLSFFQAQMYKLVHCGIKKKIFLIEGDEDTQTWRTEGGGQASKEEKLMRRLRVKTTRLLVEHGHFKGVELVCTKFPDRTIGFLIYQMEVLQGSFHPIDFSAMKTMEQFTNHIKEQMNDPTFRKYLELRNQPRIGDKKAMAVIRDQNENWNKSFVSPAEKNEDIKATIEDRPIFWTRTAARLLADAAAAVHLPPQPSPAAAAPPQPPAPPPSLASSAPAVVNVRSTLASTRSSSIVERSTSITSSSSAAATTNCSSNGGSSPLNTSSASGVNSAGANNRKATGELSQGKKRDAANKTPYKKRQKTSEKLYIRHKPSDSRSYSTPKESISQNGYISANPLHESRNSSLVAALLNDEKLGKDNSACCKNACANRSGAKSRSEEFQYMLEFSEDDIEGQVVAVPISSNQNTKIDASENDAPTRYVAQNNDTSLASKYASKGSRWYDEYKDLLSSSGDDSVSSAEKGGVKLDNSKQGGAKKANENDVIVIDEDDDNYSVSSVIVID